MERDIHTRKVFEDLGEEDSSNGGGCENYLDVDWLTSALSDLLLAMEPNVEGFTLSSILFIVYKLLYLAKTPWEGISQGIKRSINTILLPSVSPRVISLQGQILSISGETAPPRISR